jgi:ATP-dependent RNA helicase RhlE
LAELLRAEPIDRALVFTRTKHGADKVVRALAKAGLAAEAIHGNKSQPQRERVLAAFRAGRVRTLVATDIAARGIDIDGVSHVLNYDLPNIPESYVHRIGRTGRAGADGVAISFCDGDERAYLRDIEKLIRMSIPTSEHASSRQSQPANGARARPPQQPRTGRARRSPAPQDAGQTHSHRQKHPHQERRQRAPAASDGSISSLAFMRPTHRPRPQRGQAHQRTPR